LDPKLNGECGPFLNSAFGTSVVNIRYAPDVTSGWHHRPYNSQVTMVVQQELRPRLGVTAGPHEELMNFVKGLLAKEGVDVKVVVFTDYVAPNLALSDGSLDANSFQHDPYFRTFITDKKLDLVNIGKTVVLPMAIYSNKVKSVKDLKKGATISIPNDPTNGGRALLLLQSAGVIKLKKDAGLKATVFDITDNPKDVKIKELDAAQLPRSLQDVDVAVINSNYALDAGLNPVKNSIYRESSESPYANIIVVRTKDKDKPVFKKLLKAYQSEAVAKFIDERFKGAVVVGWE
jgi:D-methionine transport system substrate-binding protein